LSQEFKDSLHLFKQTLIRDLLDWLYPEATLLQYVDDLLQCRATEPLICRATESFLKLSGPWEYKVSKEKAQLCLPQVTYQAMVLKGQTHSLSHERIDPILCFPLPHSIKQLKVFLGVTGFCRIWIPRYAALS
jgi:thymidylate synthase ThyX